MPAPSDDRLPEALVELEQLLAVGGLGELRRDLQQLRAERAGRRAPRTVARGRRRSRPASRARWEQRREPVDRLDVLGDDREQIQAGGPPVVEHGRAPALAHPDETHLLQALDRLPDDVAVDLQRLAQLALGGDRRADAVGAGDDLRGDLLEDPVGQRASVECLQSHHARQLTEWLDQLSSVLRPD